MTRSSTLWSKSSTNNLRAGRNQFRQSASSLAAFAQPMAPLLDHENELMPAGLLPLIDDGLQDLLGLDASRHLRAVHAVVQREQHCQVFRVLEVQLLGHGEAHVLRRAAAVREEHLGRVVEHEHADEQAIRRLQKRRHDATPQLPCALARADQPTPRGASKSPSSRWPKAR
eukprot:scaffold1298_cov257-Pinguiococcus_pyrenoidosus.AAC.9